MGYAFRPVAFDGRRYRIGELQCGAFEHGHVGSGANEQRRIANSFTSFRAPTTGRGRIHDAQTSIECLLRAKLRPGPLQLFVADARVGADQKPFTTKTKKYPSSRIASPATDVVMAPNRFDRIQPEIPRLARNDSIPDMKAIVVH